MFATSFLAAVLAVASPAVASMPAGHAAPHAAGREHASTIAAPRTQVVFGEAGAAVEDAAGEAWRPRSIKGCGLAIGAFVGAVTAGAANPLLIGLVGSAAFHAALYACT